MRVHSRMAARERDERKLERDENGFRTCGLPPKQRGRVRLRQEEERNDEEQSSPTRQCQARGSASAARSDGERCDELDATSRLNPVRPPVAQRALRDPAADDRTCEGGFWRQAEFGKCSSRGDETDRGKGRSCLVQAGSTSQHSSRVRQTSKSFANDAQSRNRKQRKRPAPLFPIPQVAHRRSCVRERGRRKAAGKKAGSPTRSA